MVKVRRRPQNQRPSYFRLALILFIVYQSVNLLVKIVDSVTEEPVVDENSSSLSDVLHHPRRASSAQQPPAKQADQSTISFHEVLEEETHKAQPEDVVLTKHGRGPAKLGYVVDLVQERHQAAFRELKLPDAAHYQQQSKQVAQSLDKGDWKACEIIDVNEGQQLHSNCHDPDVVLAAYNDAPFPRYACGKEVKPQQAIELEKACDDVRLFASEPYLDGNERDPIVVVDYQHKDMDVELKDITCDVPCQFEKALVGHTDSSNQLAVAGTDWKIVRTMGDPYFNPSARIERIHFKSDIYYSTTSFLSSIPLSFYNFDKHNLRNTKPIDWSKAPNKSTYIANSNCNAGRRNKWFAAVAAAMQVEAYGSCEHNTELPAGVSLATLEERLEVMKLNRIVLVLEAGNDKDYITSQVWEALLAGSVPAIFGAVNLDKRLPNKSAIFANNFNNWDKFAAYIKEVAESQTLWESFHAWRSDESELQKFETMVAFTRTHPDCRLCRWAYAKQYGLGWNHSQLTIQESRIPRKLCVGGSDFVTQPFREIWNGNRGTGKESCTKTTIQGTFGGIERKVVAHDGVVDIELLRVEKQWTLRLEFDVSNTDGAYFRDTHALVKAKRTPLVSSASIQDDVAKVTVLTDWETEIISPSEGVIEILVETGARRIRVIPEDMSTLHDKLTEYYPSTYGRIMIHDFVDPLELYYHA